MKSSDDEVNQLILSGKPMDAFEKFYADNIEMCENFDAPCLGKDANRKRELEFFGKVGEFHGAELLSTAYDDKKKSASRNGCGTSRSRAARAYSSSKSPCAAGATARFITSGSTTSRRCSAASARGRADGR